MADRQQEPEIPNAFDFFSQPNELPRNNRRSSILKPMDVNEMVREETVQKRQSRRISFAKNVFCQELLPDGTTQVVTEAFTAHEDTKEEIVDKENASQMSLESLNEDAQESRMDITTLGGIDDDDIFGSSSEEDEEMNDKTGMKEKTEVLELPQKPAAEKSATLALQPNVHREKCVAPSPSKALLSQKVVTSKPAVRQNSAAASQEKLPAIKKTSKENVPAALRQAVEASSKVATPEVPRKATIRPMPAIGRGLFTIHNNARALGMRKLSYRPDMHEALRKRVQELTREAAEECLSDMSNPGTPLSLTPRKGCNGKSDISLEVFSSQGSQPKSPEHVTNFITLPMEIEQQFESADNRESVAMSIDDSLSHPSPHQGVPRSSAKTMISERTMDETLCSRNARKKSDLAAKTFVHDKTMEMTLALNFKGDFCSNTEKTMDITMAANAEESEDDGEEATKEDTFVGEVDEKDEEEDDGKCKLNVIREVSKSDVQDILDSVISSQEQVPMGEETTTQLIPMMSQRSFDFEKSSVHRRSALDQTATGDVTSKMSSLISETSSTSSVPDYPDESIFEKSFNVTMAPDKIGETLEESIYDFGVAADTSVCFSMIASDETIMVADMDQTLCFAADELDRKVEEVTDAIFNRTVRLSDAGGDNIFPGIYVSLSKFNARQYQATYTSLDEDFATINFLMDTLAVVIEFGQTIRTFNGIPIKPIKSLKLESAIAAEKPLEVFNFVYAVKLNDVDKPILKAGHDLVTSWFDETKNDLLKKFPTSDVLDELLEEIALPMMRALSMVCELKLLDVLHPMTFVGKSADVYEFEFRLTGIKQHISVTIPILPKTYPFEVMKPKLCTHPDDRSLYNPTAFSIGINQIPPGPKYAFRLLKGSKMFVKCQKKHNFDQARAKKRRQLSLAHAEAKKTRM